MARKVPSEVLETNAIVIGLLHETLSRMDGTSGITMGSRRGRGGAQHPRSGPDSHREKNWRQTRLQKVAEKREVLTPPSKKMKTVKEEM